MPGPLAQTLALSHPAEMMIAVLVGFGFGWVLERAGFGRSDNLAAIFYGRDFRVLRVMFTAIATAMVGLYSLDLAGILPLPSVGILDTYTGGQLAGGLLVGAGFIVGGWCPGTSIVGFVSGKIDALLFIAGLVVGSLAFTMGADSFAPLQDAGAKGRVLLHEFLGVPSGAMVVAVALFAVGAFWAVGRIERAVRARRLAAGGPLAERANAPKTPPPRFDPRVGAGVLVAAALLTAGVSLATGHAARAEVPPDLSARPADAALDVWRSASLMVKEDALVVDMRPADAHARYHLPGARSLPSATAADVRSAAGTRPVLVYAGKDEVAQKVVSDLRREGLERAWYLADGARAWYLALELPVPLFSESGPPDGYAEALRRVKAWFERPEPAVRPRVEGALQELARVNYQPTLLKAGKKAAAAGGARKKISGGCG